MPVSHAPTCAVITCGKISVVQTENVNIYIITHLVHELSGISGYVHTPGCKVGSC